MLYHVRTKFDLEQLKRVSNTLLRTEIRELLPSEVELVVDFHLRPYYGDEDETEGLYHSEAKAGTTAFHAYATLYARVRHKRYTLAVRRVTDGDTSREVLAEFLGLVSNWPIDVKAIFLDREFYNSGCLALLQAHNYAYVMPVVAWGRTIQSELDQGWSRQIEHSLSVSADDHEWTVDFPVYIDCTYQQGRYDEHGVARHGYAAEAPFIETPRQARYHYDKRFGIEASYRLSEQSIISTSTRNPPHGCCLWSSVSSSRTCGDTSTGSSSPHHDGVVDSSGGGHLPNLSTWSRGPPGGQFAFARPSRRTGHLTTDSSGSLDRDRLRLSGNTGRSAADS